jgi:hypothetical protein
MWRYVTATKETRVVAFKHRNKGANSALGALWDLLVFFAVLACSAVAIIVIALGAPLAIAVSAVAGALSPKREPRRWRNAHAG